MVYGTHLLKRWEESSILCRSLCSSQCWNCCYRQGWFKPGRHLGMASTIFLAEAFPPHNCSEVRTVIASIHLIFVQTFACLGSVYDSYLMESRKELENDGIFSDCAQIAKLCSGTTPLGTALDRKVLQPMVISQARSNTMQKPVLVICITDGKFCFPSPIPPVALHHTDHLLA